MQAKRWVRKAQQYESCVVPANATSHEVDLSKVISCASCGKEIVYGDAKTSLEIFQDNGIFAYHVCPTCYEEEMKRELE